jgi:hypothetical protein
MIPTSTAALLTFVVAMTGGGGISPNPVCPTGKTAVPVYHTVNGRKMFWHYNCVTPAAKTASPAPKAS